jgi:threonine dehydrogenase-like Zn-dependent dehydrogenase
MRAAVWHGRNDIRVETVPDPSIKESTDAIIRVTSSGYADRTFICTR